MDGLLIYDSLAGPALAHRIDRTNGWKEFSLYRAASENGTMTVTFALSGFGQAWIDQVTVQAVTATTGPLVQRPDAAKR
jgi:hypothetical protein